MSQQKGTALTGAALTDETVASSDSIFQRGLTGQKGLQQFYSPPQVAKLVRNVIGRNVAAIDLTAGNGALLSHFDAPYSYGVEIDKDQVKGAEGSYNAVQGDLQHVYPLLRLTMPEWDAVVLNPPFGLKWNDPSYRNGKPTNSTVLAFHYGVKLLNEQGQIVLVAGRDRFFRQIAKMPEAAGIYAVIEVDGDLFENASEPCVIAFGIHEGNRSVESEGFETRKFPVEMLDLAEVWVREQRQNVLGTYGMVSSHTWAHHRLPDAFKALQAEYDRRTHKRLKTNREYDCLLVGGKIVQWLPSAFATQALVQAGKQHMFNGLNGQSINYFSNQERVWNALGQMAQQGIVTVEPKLAVIVQELIDAANKELVPLYTIKPQQRLGWLTDKEYLRCKVSNDKHGKFVAGEDYHLYTSSETVFTETAKMVESKKNPGEYDVQKIRTMQKQLKVRVGDWTFFDSGDDASGDIQHLIDHFEMPDPGTVADKYPTEIAAMETLLREIFADFEKNSREWEKKHPKAMPFRARNFQVQDIARLVFKGGGILSWEQGLGKTLGALAFAEACVRLGAQDARLFVVPGDLKRQWTRECERFYGHKPEIIKTKPTIFFERDEKTGKLVKKKTTGVHGQCRQIDKHLRGGGTGTYLTHYEALVISGTRGRNKLLPTITVREDEMRRQVKGTGRYGYFVFNDDSDENGWHDAAGEVRLQTPIKDYYADREKEPYAFKADGNKKIVRSGYIQPRWETYLKKITSKDICPACEAVESDGWNGRVCEAKKPDGSVCGYAHWATKLKPAASYLSQSFKNGVIVMDEITAIQGETSKRSIALRGLYARHKLGSTGTPIKNFVAQAYWLLWWTLGNGSQRFGYEYEGGYAKFENDFSVIQWTMAGRKAMNRKALPEVTNLSVLWRLLASSIIRRRKEETGERLVPKYYHEINVPLGMAQAELVSAMYRDFHKLFAELYPDKPVVKSGAHEIMAPLLGLNAKLDYALTLPEADPHADWWNVPGVSNWTPAAYRTIELAMALAKTGRKVLIGSNLVSTSKWIADRLNEKGVSAVHILDESGMTTSADNRADRVAQFQDDDISVFCAGVKAIRLGHNLDAANAVILHGLDWDFETLDQFIARIHRLTSQKPVDVYTILPKLEGQETLTTKKWKLLTAKGEAASLALDGRLIERHEEEIPMADVIRDLQSRGMTVTDEAVDEVSVAEWFDALPTLDDYVVPEGLIPPTPEADPEEDAAWAAFNFLRFHWNEWQVSLTNPIVPSADLDESEVLDAIEDEDATEEDDVGIQFDNPQDDDGTWLVVETDGGTVELPTPEANGYKAEVIADDSGTWSGNALVFEREAHAESYARDLMGRWMLVREWRVVETDELPNYWWDETTGKAVAVKDYKVAETQSMANSVEYGGVDEPAEELTEADEANYASLYGSGPIVAVEQYDEPIGPQLEVVPDEPEEIESDHSDADDDIDVLEDVVPDSLVLEQNKDEMPEMPESATNEAIAQLMAEMAKMKADLATVQADNETLKKRLATDEQLTLDLAV